MMTAQALRAGAGAALVVTVALLSGCSVPAEPVATTGPSQSTLQIVTTDQAEPSPLEALLQAELVVDGSGCVHAESDEGRATLAWPRGYSVAGDATSFQILDAQGDVVAVSGTPLNIGGGGIDSPGDSWMGLDCMSGSLWWVGEITSG